MIPEYPKFIKLELSDMPELKKHLAANERRICELALTNLIIWRDFDRPRLTRINGNICIMIEPQNESAFFLEPLGQNDLKSTLTICLAKTGKLSRLSENFMASLELKEFRVKCLRSHFDYIYRTRTLAQLKGKAYDGKRNHIKNFQKRHPDYSYAPLDPKMKDECLRLFEDWFKVRQESRHFPKLAHTAQQQALAEAFEHYQALDLLGGALFVGRELKGFIMGSRQNGSTIAAHFQYAHPGLRGVFQALLWQACNKTFCEYEYVNLEQDLGIPGIRKAKLSYHPEKLEKKFELTFAASGSA
ncbi:MAG: DUF2156 domain-containing protein [Candidatus Saganbacteria bacterium]|nr:DUF2156 domain-containing protein [Candidatus Saganbacteria bacterium]